MRRLAMEKSARAVAVASGCSRTSGPPEGGPYVLAADTAVVVDGAILGKPAGDVDARRMLEQLSGRDHRGPDGNQPPQRIGRARRGRVDHRVVLALSPEDLDWYVASGEGRDKAGGYAIQGLASRFIPRIDGSYSNVVGLPVHRVAQLMTEMGYAPVDREI